MPKILEVGCGTGGNIEMLSKYGETFALEKETSAVDYARKKYPNIKQGHLPNNIPFDERFDLICMFDVLEHVEEESLSIQNLKKLLKPNGILLITVPAFQCLYGSHDKLLHHKRRYTLTQLQLLLSEFTVIKKTYFNTFLFPLLVISRLIDKLFPNKINSLGYNIPNNIVNTIFYTIFKSEKILIKKFSFSFGSSVLIAVKNK